MLISKGTTPRGVTPSGLGDSLIRLEDVSCPFDFVFDALAAWLGAGPEFQILRAVIVPDAIDMVHILFRQEFPAENVLHHLSMLKDLRGVLTVGARPRVAQRNTNYDAPARVLELPT